MIIMIDDDDEFLYVTAYSWAISSKQIYQSILLNKTKYTSLLHCHYLFCFLVLDKTQVVLSAVLLLWAYKKKRWRSQLYSNQNLPEFSLIS